MYLDIHPNISMHKGEYYIIGTKEALREVTEFKDDSLYEDGTKYFGMVPEDLAEDGKIIRVKFKFGSNIEEIIYNENFNEDQNG